MKENIKKEMKKKDKMKNNEWQKRRKVKKKKKKTNVETRMRKRPDKKKKMHEAKAT